MQRYFCKNKTHVSYLLVKCLFGATNIFAKILNFKNIFSFEVKMKDHGRPSEIVFVEMEAYVFICETLHEQALVN